MAHLGQGGDTSQVKDEDVNSGGGGWEVMAPGWYRFMVFFSAYGPNKKGNGNVLELQLKCLEPKHQDEEKRDYLSLENPSAEAVRIARTRLKELALAVGHPTPNQVSNSDELHNRPLMVRLGVEKSSDPKYGDKNGNQNRIYEYMGVDAWKAKHGGSAAGTPSAAMSAPATGAPPPQVGDPGAPPPHMDTDAPAPDEIPF